MKMSFSNCYEVFGIAEDLEKRRLVPGFLKRVAFKTGSPG